MTYDAYIITGPTASGKSDFAHRLAERIGGVIINCDSVQIYRGIENIAASPFAGRDITPDIDGISYRLFSILDLSEQISVADYLEMARREYQDATSHGRPAIFVGGTGYYINALVNGISPMPDIDANIRQQARNMVAADMAGARKILGPDFKPTDPQRTARALEVFLQTGRHITEFQSMPRSGAIIPTARKVLINPDANILRTRIAQRIPKMLVGGAESEARLIINAGWDPRRAIGAQQLCEFVRGEISRDECINSWVTKTNQYAKRQRTWFRTQFNADVILNGAEDIDAVI